MTKILYGYFTYFLHPLKVSYYFRKNREEVRAITTPFLVDDDEASLKLEEDVLQLDFSDVLLISWIFVLINCIYSLLLLNLGASLLKMVDTSGNLMENLGSPKSMIFFTLAQAVLFPIGFYVFAKLWEKIVAFFALVFNPEIEDVESVSSQIVAVSLSTHTFLLVPVLGTFIFYMAFFVYLFGGLKYNLGFRTLPGILTILSPLFFLGFVFLVIILLIVSLIVGF
jgi:hypothetical protein